MRTIKKRPAPPALSAWRTPRMVAAKAAGLIFTYPEMRRDPIVMAAVESQLLAEQGYLCAYTGRRIAHNSFHIEHLLPQHPPPGTTFYPGHDTDYRNMTACWPEPNRSETAQYGAAFKGNWPAPPQAQDFISPLQPRANTAFEFKTTGEITASNPNDRAALVTIENLNLDHKELIALRRQAIIGALSPGGNLLSLPKVRKLLRALADDEAKLTAGHDIRLRPFSFVILPHAKKLAEKLAAPAAQP